MSKRVLAILLIILGILAIAGVLYWTFRPTIQERARNTSPVASEPEAPVVPASPTPVIVPTPTAPQSATPTNSIEEQEQQLIRHRASAFAARQGSYTNADGFVALRDVYLDVSPTVRAFYQAEQQRLTQEHSLAKGLWTQTTRSLSSKITSDMPVIGKSQVVVSVQAQQSIESGTASAALSYREFMVTLSREQGRWVVSRIESRPLDL